MEITVLGHVCIDKNTSESSSYSAAGSPAMFMHKIFQQLPDNEVTIIAPYGGDFLKYRNGARFYPDKPLSEKTLTYENIIKNGVRIQKAHHRDAAGPVAIDNRIRILASESDIVLIAPLTPDFPPGYLKKILSETKPETLKVLSPQGYFRKFNHRDTVLVRPFREAGVILPLVDVVIVSEQDYPDMLFIAGTWAKTHKITIVVTLGAKGAVAFTSGKQIRLPTRPVSENKVVDSVGSGDIFSAGFAYRYQQTRDIGKAGKFANSLARQCLFFTPGEIKIDYQSLLI